MSAPWFGGVAQDLLNTTFIALGTGIVVAILARRLPGLWREGLLQPAARSFGRQGILWIILLAALAGALYAIVAHAGFSGKPLLIDEIVQVYQARLLAEGRIWVPAAPYPEFFSNLHIVEQDGRVYSQFPIGGPAMLALGSLVRAEWLVGPLFGAGTVVGFGLLVRRIEPRPLIALGAVALAALAPFAVFMSASHMNHVPALFWLVLGMLFLRRVEEGGGGGSRDAFFCGLGFGLAATIRPLDALAFAAPAGLWLGWLALRQRRLGPLLLAGLGVLIPLALLAWTNRETTGSPWLFGYSVLWGAGHGLGFHTPPWGEPHTPVRGLELINLYFLRLQSYLYESGIPSLLPATVALALTRRLSGFDRYLLAGSGLLVGLYWAYWHDGFYLGPRFLYPLVPVLALWTARSLEALRRTLGAGHLLTRAAVVTGLVALIIGATVRAPGRLTQYRSGLITLRWEVDRAARQAGVRDALVRESWGAELVARLWAAGVTHPEADALYRKSDPCRLDSALTRLESRGARGNQVFAALAPLQADSSRLVATPISGDPSLRLVPGRPYAVSCIERIRENQTGFTLLAPLLLARYGKNVYARDLGPRDTLLLRLYPDRPLFLLKPESGAVGAEPVFHRLDRDSALAAWRRAGRGGDR